MEKGFVIIVKDYKAEIVEFFTLKIISMPDGSRIYYVITKYGNEYFKETDLSTTRESLEQECSAMNEALGKVHGASRVY